MIHRQGTDLSLGGWENAACQATESDHKLVFSVSVRGKRDVEKARRNHIVDYEATMNDMCSAVFQEAAKQLEQHTLRMSCRIHTYLCHRTFAPFPSQTPFLSPLRIVVLDEKWHNTKTVGCVSDEIAACRAVQNLAHRAMVSLYRIVPTTDSKI